jgi:hypothetical protein
VAEQVSDNNRIQPRSASRRADARREHRLTKLEVLVSRKSIYYYSSIVCNQKFIEVGERSDYDAFRPQISQYGKITKSI